MASAVAAWLRLRRMRRMTAAAAVVVALSCSKQAAAERSTFQTFGTDQGLTSLDGSSLAQDGAGNILIATEHGVFAFDGQVFVNLGTEQGLRQGGIVFAISFTSAGRMAVRYADDVYVSDQPSSPSRPATSLSFHPVDHPGISFYNEQSHRLAPWKEGFLLLTDEAAVQITLSHAGATRVETLGYGRSDRALLGHANGIFTVDGHIWETFDDGRICAADPGAVRCYGRAEGLPDGPWADLAADSTGRIMARSFSAVASFDSATGRWSSSALPDQGGLYQAYPADLGLYKAPDGRLMTQSGHGLDVLGPQGWQEMTIADGAPSGTIVSAMTDGAGQLWFHILGRGLVHWLGYGHWETIEQSDGLSADASWETARSVDGSMWVTTDDGVDQIVGRGSVAHVSRVYPVASYALAATPLGHVWAGYRETGVRVIDPATGFERVIAMPAVESIVPAPDHKVWLGTDEGLYRADDSEAPPYHPVLVRNVPLPIRSVTLDGDNGVYYLSGGQLHHWHADGSDVQISVPWPGGHLEPLTMARGIHGDLWIGGPGGLMQIVLAADQVRSTETIPDVDTGTNTIFAEMIDHRGWVWIGTTRGISVFNGNRWVSVDAGQGLISNDVDENGIREDPDGSIWITSMKGISHLRDPASLFANHPLSVAVIGAHIGSTQVASDHVPYSRDPLVVELGTPNHGFERSVLFRYRLSGVDAGWVDSSSEIVRYPFVPPGRHVLTVIGSDQLTHIQSRATQLVIEMGFPWWRQWWAECLSAASALTVLYGGMRLRYRAMYARQSELKRHVAEATAHIRHQAAHDQLTGLLIRSEIEGRLAEKLRGEQGRGEFVIALLDVDHFKRINDSYGHLGGDEVLRALGRIVRRNLRDGEFAGRYGGEEFLLVLSDLDGCAAERVLNLHLSVRHDLFKAGDKPTRVTCSIGVAWASPGDSWETLIGRADVALYEAKDAGRDRVVESRSQDARVPNPR